MESYPFIHSENTIIKVVKSQNIPVRGVGMAPQIDHEEFFENIDSEEKAYILGLLIADGSVIYPSTRKRTPLWSITLHDNDRYMIERIVQVIGIHKKISHTRNESILNVTSQKMVDDLAKYGVVPRKSFITYYPKLQDTRQNRHLIRGIFDGDGCISSNICSFYGTERLLIDIKKVLNHEAAIETGKITKRYTNGVDSFSFSARDKLSKFYHYIYDDANIFLERKYEKFKILKL